MSPEDADELLGEVYADLDRRYPPSAHVDQTPQCRVLSTNVCPNYRPRPISDPSRCDRWAITTWGYCQWCWDWRQVPDRWQSLVRVEWQRLVGVPW